MGMGILEGEADAPLSEGMDRLVRGRGRRNTAQNGESLGLEDGVVVGPAMLDLAGECE